MKSSNSNLVKSIEIENKEDKGNKYFCKIQLINEILNASLYMNNNKLICEGNMTLNKIQNQIGAFNDYNINEIFEEINMLNNKSFNLIKENNKNKLEIIFMILRRKKYLYINLDDNNNSQEDYIKCITELKEIIKMKEQTIKLLEEKLNGKNMEKEEKNIINTNDSNNDFNIKIKEPMYKVKEHTRDIYCLTVLKDGRLVSGAGDNSIIIYNKTTYKPELIIKEFSNYISCITELSSGILASCSGDKTIKLFDVKEYRYDVLQTFNYHTNSVNKIIELKNKSLVSCSSDKSIIFYQKNNNEYKKDYTLSTNDSCFSVIQTKVNEICYSEYTDNAICFYDLLERKIISTIKNINKYNGILENFIMISKEFLLIPGENKISIINVSQYNLSRVIDVPNSSWITGVCLLNKNTLFTGDGNKMIRQWKIEGNNLILISKKQNSDDYSINSLINIDDNHIASASNSIKVW